MIVDLTLTSGFFWKVLQLTKEDFIKQDVVAGVQYRFNDKIVLLNQLGIFSVSVI